MRLLDVPPSDCAFFFLFFNASPRALQAGWSGGGPGFRAAAALAAVHLPSLAAGGMDIASRAAGAEAQRHFSASRRAKPQGRPYRTQPCRKLSLSPREAAGRGIHGAPVASATARGTTRPRTE